MEQHQLLVSQLVADAVEDSSSDGAVSRIVNVLLESSTTDSERAGERLRVFGWEQEQHSSMIVWNYRVVGEASGDQYVDFSLSVEDGPDLLLSVFGLQLQIALNGVEGTSAEELDCFLELMAMAKAPVRPRGVESV
jgi:hypothetical protein